MKSTITKCALALSVLGFTFGSNVIYDHDSQWSPSIFRTIANAVEFETLTDENLAVEFESLQARVAAHKEARSLVKTKLESEETSLSDLIKLREEEIESIGTEGVTLLTRSSDFNSYFKDKSEHELKSSYEELSKQMVDFYPSQMKEVLSKKISSAQEAELLEQKAAIAVANERICENKGLLEDIKSKLAELLKDKEEVVVAVNAEEAAEDEVKEDSGFSANVTTYADFFAQIQRQQNSFFEVSPPAFLAPNSGSDPMAMFMMMSLMNNRQNSAPRSQVNTYYMNGGFGGFGYPGAGSYGGFPSLGSNESMRTPANSMPRLMPSMEGTNYTQVIPSVHRGNGAAGSFGF